MDKRVLIFLPCLTLGGAEKQGAILAQHLYRNGYDVEVWGFPTLSGDSPLRPVLESVGLRVVELEKWPELDWQLMVSEDSFLRRFKERIKWERDLFYFSRTLPRRMFDIVVPFTPWPSLVSCLFARRLGSKLVFWNHRGGYDPGGIQYSPFITRAVRSVSPKFIANSQVGASFVENLFGLDQNVVSVVPNVFLTGEGLPLIDHRQPVGDREPVQLVHVANFFKEKDGVTLIRAMGVLKASGIRFQLHLIGGFPDLKYRSLLVKLAASLAVTDSVSFYGTLQNEEIFKILQSAHIGLLSSLTEGAPNSIMEYMYFRLPVVASNIPGILEVVGIDNEKYLFPVGNHLKLASLVTALAKDRSLCIDIGESNHRRILEKYSLEHVMPIWYQILGLDL
jgi:glycosyltransferase involved in cell wall biosynthesis